MKKTFIFSFILICFSDILSAQPWKRNRWEALGYVGVSNFLGELGGTSDVGGEGLAGFRDIELKTTRHVLGIGMQYRMGEQFFSRVNIIHGKVSGNDKLINLPPPTPGGTEGGHFRQWRNLHFRSPILELSYNLLFTIQKEQGGHKYKLKGVRGRKAFQMNTYFFTGIGGFWYNPKAKYEGKWVALRPLGTEGQGLGAINYSDYNINPPSNKYSPVSVCIPIGFGFRRNVSRQLNVAFEIGIRKTFTDYIDDVSTVYYDPRLMGEKSARLMDPSYQLDKSYDPNADAASLVDPLLSYTTSPGQKRGDPDDKDVYMFIVVSFNYVMKQGQRSFFPKF